MSSSQKRPDFVLDVPYDWKSAITLRYLCMQIAFFQFEVYFSGGVIHKIHNTKSALLVLTRNSISQFFVNINF